MYISSPFCLICVRSGWELFSASCIYFTLRISSSPVRSLEWRRSQKVLSVWLKIVYFSYDSTKFKKNNILTNNSSIFLTLWKWKQWLLCKTWENYFLQPQQIGQSYHLTFQFHSVNHVNKTLHPINLSITWCNGMLPHLHTMVGWLKSGIKLFKKKVIKHK